jgi:hypothetical protein
LIALVGVVAFARRVVGAAIVEIAVVVAVVAIVAAIYEESAGMVAVDVGDWENERLLVGMCRKTEEMMKTRWRDEKISGWCLSPHLGPQIPSLPSHRKFRHVQIGRMRGFEET